MGLACCFAVSFAQAATLPDPDSPFTTIAGVGITSPTANPDGTYDFTTSTGAGANWAVNQWGNPDTLFPPFVHRQAGTSMQFVSSSSRGVVVASRSPAGQFIFRLNQNGQTLACGGAIVPREFDLFIAPNSIAFNPAFPSATLADSLPAAVPNLGAMSALTAHGTVRLSHDWVPPLASKCVVNQGSVLYSLILTDKATVPPQVLFYQIDLTRLLCAPGTDPNRYAWCLNYAPGFAYFQAMPITDKTGKTIEYQYGLDDPVTSFGAPFLQVSATPTAYNLNLLPRITAVIRAGSPFVPGVAQMDTNPANWTVTKMYMGQHIWGDIGIETEWNGMLPVAAD